MMSRLQLKGGAAGNPKHLDARASGSIAGNLKWSISLCRQMINSFMFLDFIEGSLYLIHIFLFPFPPIDLRSNAHSTLSLPKHSLRIATIHSNPSNGRDRAVNHIPANTADSWMLIYHARQVRSQRPQ